MAHTGMSLVLVSQTSQGYKVFGCREISISRTGAFIETYYGAFGKDRDTQEHSLKVRQRQLRRRRKGTTEIKAPEWARV